MGAQSAATMGFGPMTGPKRPMMGPKHLSTHRASYPARTYTPAQQNAGTRRIAVHVQHLIDSSAATDAENNALDDDSEKDALSDSDDALVLPLLALDGGLSKVPFPTIRHTFKCTPHHAQIATAALKSESRQVVLSTASTVGLYGTRAIVEAFNKDTAMATVMCTHRCVITEVNTPKSRLLGSPSVLPAARLRVESSLPSDTNKRRGSKRGQLGSSNSLRKGEIKVVTPVDVLGLEEEAASLVGRVKDLLSKLQRKCESLDTAEAQDFLTALRATNPGWNVPSGPMRLSWFAAEVLPFTQADREALLMQNSVVARLTAAAELIERLLQDEIAPEQETEEETAAELDSTADTRNPIPRRPERAKNRLLGSPSDPPEGKSDLRIDKGRGFLEDPIVWQSNAKVPAMDVPEVAKMFLNRSGEGDYDDDDDCD